MSCLYRYVSTCIESPPPNSYDRAIIIAQAGSAKIDTIEKEPGDVKTLRWWTMEAWRSGRLPAVPLASRQELRQEERDTMLKLKAKLLYREGKANVALGHAALAAGDRVLSREEVVQVQTHMKRAMECE